MPNWCDNTVTLRHQDKEKIEEVRKVLIGGTKELFETLRPNPKGEWEYDWSVENWGCKWDAGIGDYELRSENEVWISFNTAWAPPTVLYDFLVEEGWEVEALYHESGMAFVGQYTTEGGDEYYEYDRRDRDSIDRLPQDCIDFAGLEDAYEEWLTEASEEYMEDLTRTEWYGASTLPFHVGRYEVMTTAWPYAQFCNWDGEKWSRWEGDEIKVSEWRGLSEEFTEEKQKEMMEYITENL